MHGIGHGWPDAVADGYRREGNMRKQVIRGMAMLLCAVVFLTGCGGEWQDSEEETLTVGVVTKSSTSEYWMSLCEGLQAAADEHGIDVIILQPDMETNKEAQLKMIETLAKKKVDIIAVSPIDSGAAQEYLEAVEGNDIPLISYDDGFDGQEIPYVGIDNEEAGYELMKYMAKQMGHKGEVGIISGPLTQKCHRDRIKGAKRYLEEEPGMTLAYVESGYSNLQMKEEEIRRLEEEYPQVEGVMVTSAATAMGFADAVSDKNMKIVSVDAQSDAVDALREGKITALTAQSGYTVGYETIRYILETQRQKTAQTQRILDAELLTEDTVEDYVQPENTGRYRKE